jgi:hypothetical protein
MPSARALRTLGLFTNVLEGEFSEDHMQDPVWVWPRRPRITFEAPCVMPRSHVSSRSVHDLAKK